MEENKGPITLKKIRKTSRLHSFSLALKVKEPEELGLRK
jgi:hypothetical protein